MTSNSIEPTIPASALQVPAELEGLVTAGVELAANRHSPNTRRSYESDFRHFTDWCETTSTRTGTELAALPAEPGTVWLYLSALVEADNAAGYKVSTLERRLSAIRWVHETSGHPSPTTHTRVRELMAGIRRTYGQPPDRRDPLSTDQIAAMIATLDLDTKAGLRDRALLLFGYAGGFRRSELAGLQRDQLARTQKGYRVTLIRTKDDQEAQGRPVGIPAFNGSPLCPVAAIDAWLTAAEITQGPIFRRVTRWDTPGQNPLNSGSIARILKRMATAAGIPPDRIAGHSLRAGHATTAAENGAADRVIMNQTGHKSVDTLNSYIRPATVFNDNSADYLDLDRPTSDER